MAADRMVARAAPALILLASLGALGAALVAQYGFGLEPCTLCIYQRIPYALAGLLAAVALLPSVPERLRVMLIRLCCLVFLADTGIAVFHVGVEQHWWKGLASCSAGGTQVQDISDLKAMLAKPAAGPSCDSIAWQMFGISMAGYNVLATLALAIFAGWAARQAKEVR